MSNSPRSRASPFRALLAGIIVGAAGGMTGMYMHMRNPAPAPETRLAAAGECDGRASGDRSDTQEPGRQAKDFDFYGVLENVPVPPTRPDLERPPLPPVVDVPAHPSKPGTPPAPAASPAPAAPAAQADPIYLQMASFKTPEEAEALKARLALAGQNTRVVAMELPDKGTYYRVRVGPFADKEEALQAGLRMQQAGIDPGGALLVH